MAIDISVVARPLLEWTSGSRFMRHKLGDLCKGLAARTNLGLYVGAILYGRQLAYKSWGILDAVEKI